MFLKQNNNYSCLAIASVNYVRWDYDQKGKRDWFPFLTYDKFCEIVGHDGSEEIYGDDHPQRGFHVDDVLKYFNHLYKKSFFCGDAIKETLYYENGIITDRKVFNKPFQEKIKDQNGILVVKVNEVYCHAYTKIEDQFVNPKTGRIQYSIPFTKQIFIGVEESFSSA